MAGFAAILLASAIVARERHGQHTRVWLCHSLPTLIKGCLLHGAHCLLPHLTLAGVDLLAS